MSDEVPRDPGDVATEFTPASQREAAIVSMLSQSHEILRLLGKGGFASVYKVNNKQLDRIEALKVLSEELTQDEQFLNRFVVEAKVCASFTHPNIVTIYEFKKIREVYYFTMQYVDGPPLSRFLKPENRLPKDKVCKILADVCDAIHYAHEKRVIHRDIKPDNIILDDDGRAYVTDFGIAKSDKGLTRTRTGLFLGSFHYASPEQAEGHVIDARTDIYALGVTLYALLTGRYPFEGETPFSIMSKKLTEPPTPPDAHIPGVHPGLVEIMLKCLERNPADRFQTASELAWNLRHYKETIADKVRTPTVRTPTVRPTPTAPRLYAARPKRHWALLPVVGLIAVAIGIGFVVMSPGTESAQETQIPEVLALGDTPDAPSDAPSQPSSATSEASVALLLEENRGREGQRSPAEDLLDVAEQLIGDSATRADLLLAKARIDEALTEDDSSPRALKLALSVEQRLNGLKERERRRQQEARNRENEQQEAIAASFQDELQTTVQGLEQDLAARRYDDCMEKAIAARAKIEGLPTAEQFRYIALKERVLDVYHKASGGKQRRDSQLSEIRRIAELMEQGSLASASTAADLFLAKPDLEPDNREQVEQMRLSIKEQWDQQVNVPSAFGKTGHKKKKPN